jgi:shikimate kinase
MNIVLIGFASSGKTATAKALRRKEGFRFVDLDRVIENRYEQQRGSRLTCREIFKEAGADGFAKLESDALLSVSHIRNAALSTGGGTPMDANNRPILRSIGRVVYLKCRADTALARMKRKGIPMSMGGTPEGVAQEWAKRDPVYTELADIVIDNDTISPDETAAAIVGKLMMQ